MSDRISRNRWGGIGGGTIQPSGYFCVAENDGIFWLVDPDGGRFLSKGVNTVCFDQDHILGSPRIPYAEACTRKYGSEAAWRVAAGARLAGWGFNTLGSWSDQRLEDSGSFALAVTPNLDLGMSFAWITNGKFKEGPFRNFPMFSTSTSNVTCAVGRANYALRDSATNGSSAGLSTMNCAGGRIGAVLMNYLPYSLACERQRRVVRRPSPGCTRAIRILKSSIQSGARRRSPGTLWTRLRASSRLIGAHQFISATQSRRKPQIVSIPHARRFLPAAMRLPRWLGSSISK